MIFTGKPILHTSKSSLVIKTNHGHWIMFCNTCKEHIQQWTNGKRKSLSFGIPMIRQAPSNHHNDCYFCLVPNGYGFNKKNCKSIQFPSLPSAIQLIPHAEHIPVPIFKGLLEEDDYELLQAAPVTMSTKLKTKNLIHQVQSHNILATLS